MDLLLLIPDLFTVSNMLAIAAGVTAGLFIGSLPGLTANLGVALLLPVTFSMDVTAALLMLMSLYTAAIYGGSFSAILLHTPGTSASAATALDGFVLTQKGEANKAIRIATFSSVIGGFVSGVALLTLAPPLSLLSLKFGPAEYFMLAIFGLTVIATLSSGNMLKGLISGFAGLFLATVGMDIDSGYPRYTFGVFDLQSGVNFVPAVIGLFSLSQALLMCEEPKGRIQHVQEFGTRWRFLPTWSEIKELRATLVRSSGIGVIVGILPGAGGDIGSWVSYNETRRFAKDKSQFGKGSIHGISASEAANNAVTGSSLIPLLTLGIPGSTTAAILLGALIIHGLLPGRTLFDQHAEITYTVIFGFLLANIVMGAVGMIFGKYATKITQLPKFALVPIIIVLSVVGAYSLGNNFFDVYTMMAFGILGYFMRKTGFHPAPMILGLILGPIAETGFRQSMILANDSVAAYILKSPISLTLLALTLLSIGTAAYLEIRHGREDEAGNE